MPLSYMTRCNSRMWRYCTRAIAGGLFACQQMNDCADGALERLPVTLGVAKFRLTAVVADLGG